MNYDDNNGYVTLLKMICKKLKAYTGIETLNYAFSTQDEMNQVLEQLLCSAPEEERKVIRMYCGIDDDVMNMRAVADVLGLSRGQVFRSIENFINRACCVPYCQMLVDIKVEDCALEQSGLSGRALNCLYRARIKTMVELIDIVENNPTLLQNLRNCGEESRKEIIAKVYSLRGYKAPSYKKITIELTSDEMAECRVAVQTLVMGDIDKVLDMAGYDMGQALRTCIEVTKRIVSSQ